MLLIKTFFLHIPKKDKVVPKYIKAEIREPNPVSTQNLIPTEYIPSMAQENSPEPVTSPVIYSKRYYPQIKNKEAMPKVLNKHQVMETIKVAVINTGIFEDVKVNMIEGHTAEVIGTITKDIDGLLERYPEIEKYRIYLNLASGRKVYAKTKLDIKSNGIMVPYFESIHIGVVPFPIAFINRELEDKSDEFTAVILTKINR